MRSPKTRVWLSAIFLLTLSACAGNKPPQAPHSPVRAPSQEMLDPCQPLDQTVCSDAGCAMKQDASDRASHIECQRKDQALIDVILHLITEGVLTP